MNTNRMVLAAALLLVCLTGAVAIVTQPFVSAKVSTPPAVDPKRLEDHVKRLSVDFFPRSHDQASQIEQAARYVESELRASGATVTLQEVLAPEGQYRNIIARFGPATGPLRVIGAHYDSHGDTPGADDNASGVAGLIELARLLGRSPQAYPIELVAYTLEEPPHFRTEHMGSAWHARSLRAAGQDVEYMLSLEMIGTFLDVPGSQDYPVPGMSYLYSDRGNFIALVGQLGDFDLTRRVKGAMSGATPLPVYSINAPSAVHGIDFSDHASYWREGFPALMVTDTAFMRNKHYHLTTDTFDKLDYVRMAQVVQAVHAVTQQR